MRRMPRRQLLVTLLLGAVYTGNAGTYYAGIETVPAALAGVIVYIYPVFVAVLSLRFATRLHGRRPWFALGLAIVGVVLALGGVDIGTECRCPGWLLIVASALIYSVVDRALRPAVRRASRPVGSGRPGGRARRAGRGGHDGRDDARDGDGVRGPGARRRALAAAGDGARRRRGRTSSGSGLVASFLAIQALYAGARRVGAAQAA